MAREPSRRTGTVETSAALSFDGRRGAASARDEPGRVKAVYDGAPLQRPKAPRRVPNARLPRTDRRFGAGVVWTAIAYALVGVGALALGNRALDEYAKGLGGPGTPGGGGGGGGARQVRYIELAPLASPAPQVRQPEPEVSVEVPQPAVEVVEAPKAELKELTPEIPTLATLPARRPATNVETLGAGSGIGTGPGAGSGTGGGIGTGRGSGIGAGVGPGTGGDGGAVVAPAVRTVIYPFEDPPSDIRGMVFRVRFWVDTRGRPTKVEIDPPIGDGSFRKKLLERMRQWTFYPARTLEGRPVNGQLVVMYEP